MDGRTLLVGIGSPHGDDRIGWLVATEVARRMHEAVVVRCARTPAELLDWIDGNGILIVCDALASGAAVGSLDRWTWPAADLAVDGSRGRHDLSLVETLTLGERLGLLPPDVRIWGVAISEAEALDGVSPELLAAVPAIAERICGELCRA